MKLDLSNKPLRIACPSCGKDLGISVGQAKGHKGHTCRHCRASVTIDARQLDAAIKQLEQSVADIGKALGQFSKR